jgi:serine/threonine-protein kinase HipA
MTIDSIIEVKLWGETLGAVYTNPKTGQTYFKFAPGVENKNVLVAPILMPYPKIDNDTFGPFYDELNNPFKGLPPMVADSLPDNFGLNVIQQFLKENGHSEQITTIRLLSYIGTRAMGALEFVPSSERSEEGLIKTDLTELSNLSNQIIDDSKDSLEFTKEELFKLFQFSTSAGGAKPKAILNYNKETNNFSYPYDYIKGDVPLIIKFDGVDSKGDSHDLGRIEYIYYKLAKNCGIKMNPCGFFTDGKLSHFHTVRFDRTTSGEKIHMQTLAAITGLNPKILQNYNDVYDTILKLGLSHEDIRQQFKIMVFNYYSFNDDYHLKNISFLMDQKGKWSLSPAYDITFPYEVTNIWKRTQPLSINGKVKNIEVEDFLVIAKKYGVKKPKTIIESVKKELSQFSELAKKYQLPKSKAEKVIKCFRFDVEKKKEMGR